MLLLLSAYFFQKNISGRLSECQNCLESDLARHLIEPDLGQNCLQWLSADDKSHL